MTSTYDYSVDRFRPAGLPSSGTVTPNAPANDNDGTALVQSAPSASDLDQAAIDLTVLDPIAKPASNALPGHTAPRGARSLPMPTTSMTLADWSIELASFASKLSDSQSAIANGQLELANDRKHQDIQRTTQKIQESVKKLEAAKKKQHALGILGTIGKVFGAIAAVALTVATGGTAAPLAAALIAYTVLDTTMTVASSISQSSGGPPLDLEDLESQSLNKIAKACGADDKLAQEVGQWGTFAIQAIIAVATLANGISGAVSMVKGATTIATSSATTARIVGMAAQGVSGSTQVASGGLTVAAGVDTRSAGHAQAEKQRLDAAALVINETIQNMLGQIEQIAKQLSETMSTASAMVTSAGDTMMSIASAGSGMA